MVATSSRAPSKCPSTGVWWWGSYGGRRAVEALTPLDEELHLRREVVRRERREGRRGLGVARLGGLHRFHRDHLLRVRARVRSIATSWGAGAARGALWRLVRGGAEERVVAARGQLWG